MSEWREEAGFVLRKLGKGAGAAVRIVKSAFDDEPHEVVCYRGYANSARAWVHGRVIEQRDLGASTEGDSTLQNLIRTYRRTDSDPVSFATLKVTYGTRSAEMAADDEGFFGGWVDGSNSDADKEWLEYGVEVVNPRFSETAAVTGTGEILRLHGEARFGVISDIDDTVIQSRVSNFIQAARTVMLGNARTRLPFPGVAAFYRALRDGATGSEKNPIFYVSSSPWNIFDVISEFMELQNVPKGPLLLRDWDLKLNVLSSSRHLQHKGSIISEIIGTYPNLPFILIGDSGQHDPEIYRQMVTTFPGRILAIYIRDVTGSRERSESVAKLAREVIADK
ncbi:MAG: phosphatase domain-containing protein, partial [Gemmatimonadaceae bacterium]